MSFNGQVLRVVGLLVCLAAASAGCGSGSATPASPASELHFSYYWHTDSNSVDQYLSITNARADEAAIPLLSIVPEDASGKALQGVTAEGILGSTKGAILVPPGSAFDILRFSGDRASEVRNVSVTVKSVQWVPYSHQTPSPLVLQPIGADGSEVTKFDDFDQLRLTNPNPFSVKENVLYIVWRDPSEIPQQARLTAMFPGPVTVGANGVMSISIGDGVRAAMANRGAMAAVTIKAFLVP